MLLYKKPINFLLYLLDIMPRYLRKATLLAILKQDGSLIFEHVIQIDLKFLSNVSLILKKHTNFLFESLIEIAGLHKPSLLKSYELDYFLLSLEYNSRIRIKVLFAENELVDSLTSVFPSSNWLERECWDMFGIFFKNHLDLRRILTDYGFNLFPLRKDFPVYGYVQLRYDDQSHSLVYEPVSFSQEFRVYEFKSPWEQTK